MRISFLYEVHIKSVLMVKAFTNVDAFLMFIYGRIFIGSS
nr:MAG TPA: hypothetical protein [Caudoviricetes sp.]